MEKAENAIFKAATKKMDGAVKLRPSGENKCFLRGHLVADPVIRHASETLSVANFRLAINEDYYNVRGEVVQHTTFIDCVAFGGIEDNAVTGDVRTLQQRCRKGNHIEIAGRLQPRSYEREGATHFVTEVVVKQLSVLGGSRGPQQLPPAEVYLDEPSAMASVADGSHE